MFVILKDGYRYTGKKISENETHLILNDFKIGKVQIAKDSVAVRGGENA